MVGSVSGMSRANGLRQDLDAGLRQDVEDREVAPAAGERPLAVRDKSLEEMASDLRSLSGQIVTARVMGVGNGGARRRESTMPGRRPSAWSAICWRLNSAVPWNS